MNKNVIRVLLKNISRRAEAYLESQGRKNVIIDEELSKLSSDTFYAYILYHDGFVSYSETIEIPLEDVING